MDDTNTLEKKLDTRPDEKRPHQNVTSIDATKERQLVRKLDLHILPVVMLLYLFSFLDRVNVGNARLYGLERDLDLSADQFQTAVSLLFVTYLLSELPSNLVLKSYVRPSRWIAFITTGWGIIATLTGMVQSYPGLLVCRLLLGLFEGGLFPGAAMYLTFFYTRRELALRVGYLFVSSALAGACGGLLAYAISYMDGVGRQSAWRWLLILEGIPTVLFGFATWFALADGPETAYYLDAEEKEMMRARQAAQIGVTDEFDWKDAKKAVRDWKSWAFAVGQFCMATCLYGFSTFLPTIIKAIEPDRSSAVIQALTVPVYALGAICYMSAARFSDWRQIRGPVAVCFGLCSVLGYALLISDTNSEVHFAGCFLVALGLYVSVGIPLAWLPTNCPRYGKRTTATGLQLTIGNASGIVAPFLYPSREGPRYIRGHGVTMALAALGCVIYSSLTMYLTSENRKRARGDRDAVIQGLSEEEIVALGDESPRFHLSA